MKCLSQSMWEENQNKVGVLKDGTRHYGMSLNKFLIIELTHIIYNYVFGLAMDTHGM